MTDITNEIYAVLVFVEENNNEFLDLMDFTEGEPAWVEFNWEYAWRKFESGELSGFYHEHPFSENPKPSNVDIETMRGWVVATGQDIVCIIGNSKGVFNSWVFYGKDEKNIEGKLKTNVYYKPLFDVEISGYREYGDRRCLPDKIYVKKGKN